MEWVNNLVDYGIIGFLILLCFFVVMFAVERMLFYKSIKSDSYESRKELELDLQKNLSFIGTVASNSPYIGLLGTVMGIMLTFYNVGTSTKVDTGKIMVNLSLSLKATAAGLVVAIISVVIYNALSVATKKKLTMWDISHEG